MNISSKIGAIVIRLYKWDIMILEAEIDVDLGVSGLCLKN